MNGYITHQRPRAKRRGGGVAVIARSNLVVKEKKCHDFQSFESLDITFQSKSELLRILVIYRPPRSSSNRVSTSSFLSDFTELLESVVIEPGRLMIAGDFNFHVDDPDSRDASKLLDLLDANGLVQHVKEATHCKGHTLDLLITRESENFLFNIGVTNDLVSDHGLVHFDTCISRPPLRKVTKSRRKFNEMDSEAFKSRLSQALCEIPVSMDVNQMMTQYEHSVSQILDDLAPLKQKTIIDKPHCPWYCDELADLKREVRQCERKWKTTGLTVHREMFNSKRAEYCRRADEIKAAYHRSRIDSADTKGLFSIVNDLTSDKRQTASILPSNIPTGQLNQTMMDFFVDKVRKLRSTLPLPYLPERSVPSFAFNQFKPISIDTAAKIVEQVSSKSCSLDSVPTHILKDFKNEMVPFLANLINKSFETGTVPDAFKRAIVRPLIKKSNLDPNVLKNYRPVSNVPFYFKCLERAVIDQLNCHISSHSLCAKFQSAYRCDHSTETALLKVFNDIMVALGNKSDVILVLLDLSAVSS